MDKQISMEQFLMLQSLQNKGIPRLALLTRQTSRKRNIASNTLTVS
jgi:hypothetical protein